MDETIPPCAAPGVSSERMCGRKIVQQGMFAQMMTTCILWIVPLLIVARPVHRLRALAGGCVLEVLCTVMIPGDVLVRLFWNRMSVWLMFALLLYGVLRTSMILLLARVLLYSEEACGSLHR